VRSSCCNPWGGSSIFYFNCEDQNVVYHSPFNFIALPMSGRVCLFIYLAMRPWKEDKPFFNP